MQGYDTSVKRSLSTMAQLLWFAVGMAITAIDL